MVKENRTREAVYLDWLAERLAPAATLDRPASRLARFRRIRVARGDRGPEGPAATVHGTMTVTDPSAFARLLPHGVGRHRAYGYGMLLLRPPNHPAPRQAPEHCEHHSSYQDIGQHRRQPDKDGLELDTAAGRLPEQATGPERWA